MVHGGCRQEGAGGGHARQGLRRQVRAPGWRAGWSGAPGENGPCAALWTPPLLLLRRCAPRLRSLAIAPPSSLPTPRASGAGTTSRRTPPATTRWRSRPPSGSTTTVCGAARVAAPSEQPAPLAQPRCRAPACSPARALHCAAPRSLGPPPTAAHLHPTHPLARPPWSPPRPCRVGLRPRQVRQPLPPRLARRPHQHPGAPGRCRGGALGR